LIESKTLFTDLDGTLLDHHTYQPGPAIFALRQLLDHGVVVYFCSAKTLAEQQQLAHQLDIEVGLIAENGGVIVDPGGEEHLVGTSRSHILDALRRIRKLGVGFRGYADMTPEEVADVTGLDVGSAQLARRRQCSETLVEIDDFEHLALELAVDELRLQRGARFWTVQGNHDKGQAVEAILGRAPHGTISYGIGDAHNDQAMLLAVDHPMQVRAHDGTWAELEVPGIVMVDGVGPDGWVQAAESVLR
jgi:mannosyl-3-phosphoglycerate phosphatase family protein